MEISVWNENYRCQLVIEAYVTDFVIRKTVIRTRKTGNSNALNDLQNVIKFTRHLSLRDHNLGWGFPKFQSSVLANGQNCLVSVGTNKFEVRKSTMGGFPLKHYYLLGFNCITSDDTQMQCFTLSASDTTSLLTIFHRTNNDFFLQYQLSWQKS